MQSQYAAPMQADVAPQYVGVGRRLLALIIDVIIMTIISALIILILTYSFPASLDAIQRVERPGSVSTTQSLAVFIYFIVMEALWGATLGKMALGIRIVKVDGAPIGLGSSIVRNLLRIIDNLPFFYHFFCHCL